jgi:hypothetical protein
VLPTPSGKEIMFNLKNLSMNNFKVKQKRISSIIEFIAKIAVDRLRELQLKLSGAQQQDILPTS